MQEQLTNVKNALNSLENAWKQLRKFPMPDNGLWVMIETPLCLCQEIRKDIQSIEKCSQPWLAQEATSPKILPFKRKSG